MIRTGLNVHYEELSSQKVLRVQESGWHKVTDNPPTPRILFINETGEEPK
jgi:hypothetical protein